jgi:hypothetical protein
LVGALFLLPACVAVLWKGPKPSAEGSVIESGPAALVPKSLPS